ncbi:translation initiation factor eIF3 subunit [Actinidia rufa]|uniref:Translation initiation factor eIF3 subunit n=1 Tax=Actinidia rufa TaxID=165716 RepID=A0A7J0DVG5_9ERIC|nr:translation initiation factor eIF3 subunit [Actinidia rufa]
MIKVVPDFYLAFHYMGLLKAVIRLSMTSLKGADAKEVASSVTAIANEKIKAEKEANPGKKKTAEEDELEKNGTKLPIHELLIGSFADTWPKSSGFPTLSNWTLAATQDNDSKVFLRSALHEISPSHSKEFSTLGCRIIFEKARWGSTLKIHEVNTIQPTTFKVASMMASCQEICLAIPVLTSSYKGLNKFASSSTLAHYLYAWLAYYFNTHYLIRIALAGPKMIEYSGEGAAKYFDGFTTRTLIHKGDSISWNSISRFNNTKGLFIDKKVTENPQGLANFISIHSSRLVLCSGDSFFVESYNPHHFGRQFGYCQEIPNDLERDERSTISDIAPRSSNNSQL